MLEELHCQKPSPALSLVQSDTRMLNRIFGQNVYAKVVAADEFGCTKHMGTFLGDSNLPPTKDSSATVCANVNWQANHEVG